MKKFLVFDLDGTLIDSRKDLTTAVNLTLQHFNLPSLPMSEIERHVGTGVRKLVESKLIEAGVRELKEACELFNQYYLTHSTDETTLYPGVQEVLEYYKDYEKVILTNKMNIFVGPILNALKIRHYFLGFYGLESFATSKPDRLPLDEIAKLYNSTAPDMIMIGDTEVDIMAGKNFGCRTCAVTYGYGDERSLSRLLPDLKVNGASQLIGLI